MRCACRRWAACEIRSGRLPSFGSLRNQIRTLASAGGCTRRDLPNHFRNRRTRTGSFHAYFIEASVSRLAHHLAINKNTRAQVACAAQTSTGAKRNDLY